MAAKKSSVELRDLSEVLKEMQGSFEGVVDDCIASNISSIERQLQTNLTTSDREKLEHELQAMKELWRLERIRLYGWRNNKIKTFILVVFLIFACYLIYCLCCIICNIGYKFFNLFF